MKARNHKLAVGSRSLVGAATAGRKPVVVQDVTADPTHFKNPLLPDTRAEAVIPLLSGDRLIGALDVQSTTPGAFSDEAVQILQTLADQLSVTIENAESFQRTQASLAEVSALYEQVTGQGLRGLLGGQTRENVYDLVPGGDLLPHFNVRRLGFANESRDPHGREITDHKNRIGRAGIDILARTNLSLHHGAGDGRHDGGFAVDLSFFLKR